MQHSYLVPAHTDALLTFDERPLQSLNLQFCKTGGRGGLGAYDEFLPAC